jgi:hypothetical protein
MNYLALKNEVSDFSSKNLSLERKLLILRGLIPRQLCGGKNRPEGRGITPARSNKKSEKFGTPPSVAALRV